MITIKKGLDVPVVGSPQQVIHDGNAIKTLRFIQRARRLGILVRDVAKLLDLWRAEMRERGVALTHDEIERDYRLGILHGVSTAVFSAAFVERTERGDANFLSMARGACSLAPAMAVSRLRPGA